MSSPDEPELAARGLYFCECGQTLMLRHDQRAFCCWRELMEGTVTELIRAPSPAELAASAKAVSDAVRRRDDVIRASVAAGHSLRAIGKFVGLSHEQVRKIAARPTQDGGHHRD